MLPTPQSHILIRKSGPKVSKNKIKLVRGTKIKGNETNKLGTKMQNQYGAKIDENKSIMK